MKTVTSFFDRMVQRYLPDAFLFAIILTIIVFFIGLLFPDNGPLEMVQFWGNGFWGLLEFAMQMSLVVITGYILASTNVVKRFLSRLSKLANTPAQAIILVTFIALIACFINYGFGLVVGALFATHVAKQVPSVDYRLLIASAYSGFLIWHGGFSGSVPLTIATAGHFLEGQVGIIPITETLFSPYNLFIVITLLVALPLFNRYLLNGIADNNTYFAEKIQQTEQKPNVDANSIPTTPAEKLENSPIVSMIIGILGLSFIVYYFVTNGFNLNINIVNFIFLFLGIILHRTPRQFLDNVSQGVKNAGAIIIQFPFYAGIMGMMVDSGISEALSLWFVNISTEYTLPFLSFISAGIVNFFIPSGGGQWAIQGPIMIESALELGADTAKTAMGIAWGDAWTNMIQPFWALPALAIAGLKVRDIMGFCVMILIFSFIPISIGLLFF
ncbi:short-chain fatty acids transporter [Oceanobacillus iheyensis HTE831]|uniref:Short-chain fatty acids transporter n=1 Tax=Oceanobacillus iheyensis (strain DSM 14371 / CIP 107618 / JCM 11309 / KCTC 3954 / HTE831) TaxID=221109 RepID=Q8END7_OCEIH|nr:short-chain fatty acid transporter [Oceanobacillus iheyensis]BAC14505.1 short-chain fatty acids transporter [Oceanobacillus iheyensis HTE831]